jgi:hypothetical protein
MNDVPADDARRFFIFKIDTPTTYDFIFESDDIIKLYFAFKVVTKINFSAAAKYLGVFKSINFNNSDVSSLFNDRIKMLSFFIF